MSRRTFTFATEAEADAFFCGVQWVNDSSIQFVSKTCDTRCWILEFTDEDGDDEFVDEAGEVDDKEETVS